MRSSMKRRGWGARGFALVAVLWLGVALGLGAWSFLGKTRAAGYRLQAEIETAHAEEIARSGLNLALGHLATGRASVPRDGTPQLQALPGGQVRFRIWDEKGKADLNRSTPRLIAAALEGLEIRGFDALDYAGIADRLQATARRLKQGGNAVTLSAIFQSAQVPAALAARASEVVTIHSFSNRINPWAAHPRLLASVPGLGQEGVEAILAARREGERVPSLGAAEGWLTRAVGPVYSIEVVGTTASGVSAVMDAMVIADGRGFRSGRMRYLVLSARVRR